VLRFDAGRSDRTVAQAVDAAGNIYLAGSVEQSSSNITFSVVKLDSGGSLVWRHNYSGSRGGVGGFAQAVTLDAAGNVYAAGGISSDPFSSTSHDFLVLKLGPDGSEIWAQRYSNGDNSEFASHVAVDAGGAVYVSGRSTSITFNDWLTQRYGPDGTLQWTRGFTTAGQADDIVADIALLPNGNLAVTGTANIKGDGITNDIQTLVYNARGDTVWQRLFTDTAISDDVPLDMEVNASGQILLTGFTAFNASPENLIFGPITLRYDAAGTLLQTIRVGGAAVHFDPAGNFYLAAAINNAPGNSTVAKFTPDGVQVWKTTLTLTSVQLLTVKGIVTDPAGTVTIAGTLDTMTTLSRDYLTIRYSATGEEVGRNQFDGRGVSDRNDSVGGISIDGTGAVLVGGTSGAPTLSAREDMVVVKIP
jgi:hypothetical protein